MKAYKAWDEKSFDPCATIIFAENTGKAKKIAMATDTCEEANFIDIRVKRLKEADYLYKGSSEIDWYDEETRIALVRDFGWRCYDTSWECEKCVAKKYCSWFEDERIKEEAEKALEDMRNESNGGKIND